MAATGVTQHSWAAAASDTMHTHKWLHVRLYGWAASALGASHQRGDIGIVGAVPVIAGERKAPQGTSSEEQEQNVEVTATDSTFEKVITLG